jgi:hypothetical protein
VKTKLLAVIAATAAIAACTAPEETSRLRKINRTSEAIVGGTNVTNYSFPQVAYIEGNGYLCTGTLIDDFVLLTAAHCVEDTNAANYLVCGGDEPYADDGGCYWLVGAESVHVMPGYDPQVVGANDIGIIVLEPHPQYGGPHDQDTSLVPLPYLAADPGTVYDEGSGFTAVGFGITGVNDTTDPRKRTVQLSMNDIYLDIFEYGSSTQNTCSGDSGGPALKTVNGAQTVIGVVSYGDQNCTQFGGDSRTDYDPFTDFIASFAGAGATPTPPPGDDDDDDDDGSTPGDDDDDDGNGADEDDPLGNIGCTVASAKSAAEPIGFFALIAVAMLVRRKQR